MDGNTNHSIHVFYGRFYSHCPRSSSWPSETELHPVGKPRARVYKSSVQIYPDTSEARGSTFLNSDDSLHLVGLLPGLHPHAVGLVPRVLDRLRSVSSPQGLRSKLACGQVGRALLLCLQQRNVGASEPLRHVEVQAAPQTLQECFRQ